jgi:hypothetical protein
MRLMFRILRVFGDIHAASKGRLPPRIARRRNSIAHELLAVRNGKKFPSNGKNVPFGGCADASERVRLPGSGRWARLKSLRAAKRGLVWNTSF